MNGWKDKFLTGFLTGIAAPPVAFYLFCLFYYPDEKIIDLLNGYIRRNVLTHVISLSVLIDLPLFFILLNMKNERGAMGIIGSVFIYVFIVLLIMFL
jgi:hypothetical protein